MSERPIYHQITEEQYQEFLDLEDAVAMSKELIGRAQDQLRVMNGDTLHDRNAVRAEAYASIKVALMEKGLL